MTWKFTTLYLYINPDLEEIKRSDFENIPNIRQRI